MGSEQYEKSIDLARKVNEGAAKKGKQLTITEHSLGRFGNSWWLGNRV
ncbi:hypothetical protein HMPREF1991_00758 [Hoylesella loescheii DSM 19665 = JCM 12249 = ATCC 15930]|uniref:Uncharacterized protein n=1 Tax=Hoylesella loescheii DSM 19665 = JCM 12249 = ATCC 15930 TaxID=1122985 RepID=A0A069QKP2_HOYLO|nr:hypothetical protein HMPREF1991_00758 [Hoylesella loescheii DSM 19665 = JCM 12249 = ATCC 15930]